MRSATGRLAGELTCLPSALLSLPDITRENLLDVSSVNVKKDKAMIDSTIVRAHQHSAGVKGGCRLSLLLSFSCSTTITRTSRTLGFSSFYRC
jgi:hypothetical protein